MSFAAFIRGNREGTLPFILWAHPTPVGERVYIWLRPGLSKAELEDRGDKLAVACWSKDVVVSAASAKYAAFLRFDIKRRDTLNGVIDSPLVEVPDTPAREVQDDVADVTALDLTDVAEESVTEVSEQDTKPAKRSGTHVYKPTAPATAPAAKASADENDGAFWA
jgi:hypothetical protein